MGRDATCLDGLTAAGQVRGHLPGIQKGYLNEKKQCKEYGSLEDLPDLRMANHLLLEDRIQHALHGGLHVLDGFIDDLVQPYVHTFTLRRILGGAVRPYVEPSAGEVFLAHENDKTAKSYAETYLAQNKEKKLEETRTKMSLDDLFSQIKEGNLKELNLIVKADVQGSVEAVRQSLLKLSNDGVVVKCIHGGVGAINESDVTLASASNAITQVRTRSLPSLPSHRP